MKLTREGAARLGRHESRGFPVGDFEFRSEDFDGCFQNGKDHVILTVEEAKKLLDMGNFIKSAYPEAIVWKCAVDDLKDRIEQAENV